jgi:hypothetical protein
MDASSNMHGPAAVPAPAPRAGYPGATAFWLVADLVLCIVNALLTLSGLWLLSSGQVEDAPATALIVETALHAGIAVFGITGDVALLRHRAIGAAFAKIALLFVGAGVALSIYEVPMRLADPDASCPPETVVAGAVIGVFCRVVLNLVYLGVVRRAQRFLRGAPAAAG